MEEGMEKMLQYSIHLEAQLEMRIFYSNTRKYAELTRRGKETRKREKFNFFPSLLNENKKSFHTAAF